MFRPLRIYTAVRPQLTIELLSVRIYMLPTLRQE